ncbi:MAG: Na+:solute symporter [FCB group bacterium]|nr:Na+:solute symporter [FCB group bacterium]
MASVDWSIVFIYLALIIAGGMYFTRRAHKGLNEYFLTGRSLPWWIAGTSMVATSFSCDTPLYVTKLIRTGGIYLNWQWWSFLIGGMLSAFLLSRLWRRAEIMTDVELTELRYSGKGATFLRGFRAFYLAIPINCIAMGWVLLAMAKISSAVLGLGKWEAILVFSIAAFSYSLLAGFWGVVVTDVVQFVLALIGATVLALFAVDAAGGWNEVLTFIQSRPEQYPDTLKFIPSIKGPGAVGMISAAFIGFLTYNLVQWWANINSDGGGKVIQRINACKTEGHALGAVLWYNFAHFVLRSWPWIVAALASIKLYPHLTDPEMAYPKMIMEVLPVGVRGLVVASLIAAFMSTIDTQLNWGASYLVSDLYKRFLKPGQSEKHYLWAAKGALLLLMILAGFTAYFTDSVTEAFKFIIAFGAGTGPVYILRWFWWRINAWSEISAMIASSVISVCLYLFTDLDYALKVLITAGGSAVIWVAVAYLTPATAKEKLKEFYLRARPGGSWGPVKTGLSVNPEPVKDGIVNWLIGVAAGICFMMGIGKVIMLEAGVGMGMLGVAAGCSYWLWRRVKTD